MLYLINNVIPDSVSEETVHLAIKCKHSPVSLHALIFSLFIFNLYRDIFRYFEKKWMY